MYQYNHLLSAFWYKQQSIVTESQLFVIVRQISITASMTIIRIIIITINGYIINVNNIIIKYFVKIPSQGIIMYSAYSFVFSKSNITKLC